jgi:hypothetical protein
MNPPACEEAPGAIRFDGQFSMIVTVDSAGSDVDCKRYQALHKPIIPPPIITICCGDGDDSVDIAVKHSESMIASWRVLGQLSVTAKLQ